jgi:2-keto-3-deoxy-L-rhamnonate aldolase RhmA
MPDRLTRLLAEHRVLLGMICRDPTLTDMELFAQAGCHVVWIDLEHGAISPIEAIRLCRTITHLGMVPVARMVELNRSSVQTLLDGGFQVLVVPQIASAADASRFVDLAKYPPLGNRGVASTVAGNQFTLGPDPLQTLFEANAATHLMVQFEDDRGFAALDAIVAVPGIDMVTVGPTDWSVSKGLSPLQAHAPLVRQIEQVLTAARDAGKITAMGISSPDEAKTYAKLGVRIFFAGIDIALKRTTFDERLRVLAEAVTR